MSRVCGEEDAVVREKEKISWNVSGKEKEVDCFFPYYIQGVSEKTEQI